MRMGREWKKAVAFKGWMEAEGEELVQKLGMLWEFEPLKQRLFVLNVEAMELVIVFEFGFGWKLGL